MASFSVTEQAAADIDDILERTLERWGERKYWEYSDLIEQALVVVAQDPTRGRTPAAATQPGILGHHIKQPGRNARHIVFYNYDPTNDRVTVLRVLHDSMDFKRHLPA